MASTFGTSRIVSGGSATEFLSLDRNTTELFVENRLAPYETNRLDRMQLIAKMTFPESYRTNSQKEELCLEFVENFRFQFVALSPQRPPLLLSPVNECGKQKFISTFLRPSLIRFSELFDHETLATFLANYIQYEPLEDQEALPARVVSPSTVLEWQVGNSVEMSLVLCSLLLGAGYNAYVVVGYAAKEITDNDQSKTKWPGEVPVERDEDDDTGEVVERETMFAIKTRPLMVSEYDKKEAEKMARDLNELMPPDVETASFTEEARLFHAWVLVLPTSSTMPPLHNVAEPFFIEPTTGICIPTTKATKYLGIESIFNHLNYFVNLNSSMPASEVSLDLRDLTKWEHVFLSDAEMGEEILAFSQSKSGSAGPVVGAEDRRALEDLTNDIGATGDQILDAPASWVLPLTLSRARYENRYPGRHRTLTYSDCTVELFAEYSGDPELRVMEVKMPNSLGQEEIHTFYRHREDKLRRRSVFPSLEDRSQAASRIHEWFAPGRKRENKVEGLAELIVEPGHRRTMKFCWRAREDGLCRRVERFFERTTNVQKIQEYYRGRDDDRLIYRSATFEAPKESSTAATLGLVHAISPAAPRGGADGDANRLPIRMSEKFSPNPKINPQEDVAKRTFIKPQVADGEIWVLYQYSSNCITRPCRQFPKNVGERDKEAAQSATLSLSTSVASPAGRDVQPKVVTMPFVDPPKESELLEQLRLLLMKEKDCLQEIISRQLECREILEVRKKETADVQFVLSCYDTLRNRPRESEAELEQIRAEEARRMESKKDYLAPYIANSDIGKQCRGNYKDVRLPAETANKIKEEFLNDLKDRLIQRGHIMQNRMDKLQEEIKRRQELYQKNQDSTESTKDSEEFAQFSKDATWRLKILDERLTRHLEAATHKYETMARELQKDPRLALAYQNQPHP